MIPHLGPPGLIIAAPRSGAGKTTITLGLLRALRRRGSHVQPFKCGPDYIDPAFHEIAAGRPSYNLDSWAMGEDLIATLATKVSAGADICIAEGVMGLFDGAAARGQCGSGATADLASLLGWPVVLLLDVTGQTETAAAVALGCARYRNDVDIAGVILNRLASERHLSLLAPAFDRLKMRVFGAILRDDRLALPERHLGLVQARELPAIDERLDVLADVIGAAIDLDAIRQSARPAKAATAIRDDQSDRAQSRLRPPGQRIALAQDRAFSFIYPHLVRQWRLAGAEIIPFSPLADEAPDASADSVWLPGGYPELHAGVLASAHGFRSGLQKLAHRSIPIHGECGGYMVLGHGLEDAGGNKHEMTGLLGLETSFANRRLHLGYRRARLRVACSLGAEGTEVLGHEFHYASTVLASGDPLVDCRDAAGAEVPEQGVRQGSITGTFFHVIDRVGL
ncbi:hydrogenobyrinic acid a,c-diamide synthase (glutamine-hydrolysing) /cobyrinate a,c-diamide synthase [Bradyrhizobium lablabi]|uniref:Hydrogenobyrinate a,c-diamide synthase n=1 Tax=Bradyrhizobium lablabi TaxID=722472 RepID=A0A1M6S9L6_9BRAD|nr:cobyrinate a,c-diamide synthase [Bradyrhizobium lablabi]SHK41453.1 hydrogenobyrinic acid a,c-diamide synthase (glutamine-hydrolysing) /cobyrinate a,c-diamide synthase [Bradyrhizobium lablabi]